MVPLSAFAHFDLPGPTQYKEAGSTAPTERVIVVPVVLAGPPSALLERRPGIVAAERLMASANAQICVAANAPLNFSPFPPATEVGARERRSRRSPLDIIARQEDNHQFFVPEFGCCGSRDRFGVFRGPGFGD